MKKYIAAGSIVLIAVFFACTKTDPGSSGTSGANVSSFDCASAVFSTAATVNVNYTATATIAYTGGNGLSYGAGSPIASTGVTGLTATLAAGTLTNGLGGRLVYNITGKATTTGTASFPINFAGQYCTMSVAVNGGITLAACSNDAVITNVISKITAFESSLSSTQLAAFQQARTQALSVHWSNLTCGSQCRNGLEFSTLNPNQVKAALAILQASLGTDANQGYDAFMQIRTADDTLAAHGSAATYSSGYYFISVLGTPSTSGAWQLQYGGDHSAVNITYNNDAVAGATPMFTGVEPTSWTASGITYAPMDPKRTAMVNLLSSLNSTQLTSAKLSNTFTDVLLGPGADGQFPATKAGLAVSSMTIAQQKLVMAAMQAWVKDADTTTANCLMNTYGNELSNTYVSYATDASLSSNSAYVRIDGPSVWIEFICQAGVVFPSQVRYSSVWRDHLRDYGGSYAF